MPPDPEPDPDPQPGEWHVNLVVMGMDEDHEEDPGGFMPVNNDFDEQNTDAAGNFIPDNRPDWVYEDRIVAGDSELRSGPKT